VSASLQRKLDGSPVLLIADPQGREHLYDAAVLPRDYDAVELRRGARSYVVTRDQYGWACNCPAYGFCPSPPHQCKHTLAVAKHFAALVQMLKSPQGEQP
jgi:hypothetical protein